MDKNTDTANAATRAAWNANAAFWDERMGLAGTSKRLRIRFCSERESGTPSFSAPRLSSLTLSLQFLQHRLR